VIVFGTATDLFLGYMAPGERKVDLGPGSLYPLYPWYLGLVAGAAFVNLARALWIASRSGDRTVFYTRLEDQEPRRVRYKYTPVGSRPVTLLFS